MPRLDLLDTNDTQNSRPQSGLGLRPIHYPELLDRIKNQSETFCSSPIRWLEALTENYSESYGRPRQVLHQIREHYPVALHGVSLSLAQGGPISMEQVQALKALALEIEPWNISDHLCWTGSPSHQLHDLLPFPRNESSFHQVRQNILRVQDFLGRPISIENVSTYLEFKTDEMSEFEMLHRLTQSTGCQILLDLNNLFVNSYNHKFDPFDEIKKINLQQVAQIHLAGYTDMGTHYFDTHSKSVVPEVWKLFAWVMERRPDIPFMIERDEDIPSLRQLESELKIAITIAESAQTSGPQVTLAPVRERCHEQ